MHRRLLAPAALTCLGLALAPAAASASPAAKADLAALRAYKTYLTATVSSLPTGTGNANDLSSTVQQNCSNALSPLNNVTATRKTQAAATAFGHELDADLTLAWLAPTKAPLNAMASTLSALHWGATPPSRITTALVSAERALLNLSQSDLCENAFRLAGHPATTPGPTGNFLSRYNKAHANLVSAENAFGSLLRRDTPATGAAANLLSQDQALESQYASSTSSDEQTAASTILAELGFS